MSFLFKESQGPVTFLFEESQGPVSFLFKGSFSVLIPEIFQCPSYSRNLLCPSYSRSLRVQCPYVKSRCYQGLTSHIVFRGGCQANIAVKLIALTIQGLSSFSSFQLLPKVRQGNIGDYLELSQLAIQASQEGEGRPTFYLHSVTVGHVRILAIY